MIVPKRWKGLFYGRGILGPPGDAQMEKHAGTQDVLKQLDAREGEEQPLTA